MYEPNLFVIRKIAPLAQQLLYLLFTKQKGQILTDYLTRHKYYTKKVRHWHTNYNY